MNRHGIMGEMSTEESTDKERWNERYAVPGYKHGKDPAAFLVEAMGILGEMRGRRALVPSMGEGRNAVYLASLGLEVEGIDISEIGVRKALRLASERGMGLRAIVADLRTLPLPYSRYDLVAVFNFLQRSLFPQLRECLKPGGAIIYETMTVEQLGFGAQWVGRQAYLLKPGELRAAFEGFRILLYRESVIEDTGVGKRAVASLIGMKPD